MNRQQILIDLIKQPLKAQELRQKLIHMPWDSDSDLVTIREKDVLEILYSFIQSNLTAKEVEYWADSIECREDIQYEGGKSDLVHEVIHWLANPELEGPLTYDTAKSMYHRFNPAT